MLTNYLKIALRSFWKNGTISFINVAGLAIGLVATLLIVLYVSHEYSYDRFHANGDRIALVGFLHDEGDRSFGGYTMSYRFGEEVKRKIPGIDAFARITESGTSKLVQTSTGQAHFETGFRFADAELLRMFSFPLLTGDPATALTRPGTVLITERTAHNYFGQANPIGKTIIYDKKYPLRITGVLKNLPDNSSLQFDFLADMFTQRALEKAGYEGMMDTKTATQWINNVGTGGNYETYFLLNPHADRTAVTAKIPSLLTESERIRDRHDSYVLRSLFDVHFLVWSPDSARLSLIFAVAAGLILLLALINYVNLTTARATVRMREVSIRKTIGAARKALVLQFYLESTLYVTLAFGIAIVLFILCQPIFYDTLHLTVDLSFLRSSYFLLPVFGFYLVSIILSASYPALLLSRFSPMDTLNGVFTRTGSTSQIRQGLTVLQFTISTVLIIGAIAVRQQLHMIFQRDLGIDRARIVTVHLDPEDGLDKHYKAIRDEVKQLKGVDNVTASSLLLYSGYLNSLSVKRLGTAKSTDVFIYRVDKAFLKTMNVHWTVAASAVKQLTTSNQIVLNETAAKQLGIHRDNVEQTLDLGGDITKNVVGIIKDFHYVSLSKPIRPMALFLGQDSTFRDYLYIKLARKAPVTETLAAIQRIYDQYKTNKPFAYTFLDQTYQQLYKTELATGQIITAFTLFAILIAAMGLFGLVVFMTEQRTKEIGIRKVLGASVAGIVSLLSRDFLQLIAVSVLIAGPIAWYITHRWLQEFAYKIQLEWWMFALAALLTVGIALLTVSLQSIKAALANPADSLRSE